MVNNVHEQKTQAELEFFCMQHVYPGKINLYQGQKKGNLETWTGLTDNQISKYLLKSETTPFGHLDQSWKNTRSTKSEPLSLNIETNLFSLSIWVFSAIGLSEPTERKVFDRYHWVLPVH